LAFFCSDFTFVLAFSLDGAFDCCCCSPPISNVCAEAKAAEQTASREQIKTLELFFTWDTRLCVRGGTARK